MNRSIPETPRRRLSALLVNHNSGAWALRCVESLVNEWRRDGRDERDLEVIVFDSGSGEGEGTWFRSLRRLGARVISGEENLGYAGGLNRAWGRSSGEPDDWVALLNPDLYFLPGSLRPLLERLDEEPGVGAVAPRCFVDEMRQLHLPPNRLPRPASELAEHLAARWPRFARTLAAVRSRRALSWWTDDEPRRAEMLSGACLFLRRETVERLGEPMDEAYPLYFEDADLCARLGDLGLRLEQVPEAELLHHWSRAAGPGFEGEPARRWAISRERWMAERHGGLVGRLSRAVGALIRRATASLPAQTMHHVHDLGATVESPEVEFECEGEYLLELSLTPFWGLSAGILVEGASWRLPAGSWSWLFPGTYYLRALDRESGVVLGAWRFEKTTGARSWPLDPSSLPGPKPPPRRHVAGERVG